jgi:SDR family mycofactocin-dependent oxidoreductase
MGTLDGKVAVISGAARGQGRSHALRLAKEGADIIALDICRDIPTMDYPNATPADLERTVEEVERLDRRIRASQTDVRDLDAVRAAIDEGVAQLGRVDIVLPQAGIVRYEKSDDIVGNAAAFKDILDVNLTGYWNVVEVCIPHLIAGGRGGVIVMTGSVAATRPVGATGASVAYMAAKHATVGMMKTYALALAKHNIRVNVVHPTGVRSGMTENAAMARIAAEAASGNAREDNWVARSQNLLDVQILEPEDITDAVAFLVSEQAKWLTGQEIKVDAGFTLL